MFSEKVCLVKDTISGETHMLTFYKSCNFCNENSEGKQCYMDNGTPDTCPYVIENYQIIVLVHDPIEDLIEDLIDEIQAGDNVLPTV